MPPSSFCIPAPLSKFRRWLHLRGDCQECTDSVLFRHPVLPLEHLSSAQVKELNKLNKLKRYLMTPGHSFLPKQSFYLFAC